MSKQWTSIWLGLLPAYLIRDPLHCFRNNSKRVFKRVLVYLIKNIQFETEKKKKKNRGEMPLLLEMLFSKLMLIGKFLPTFCHAKLILSNCSHWNHKNFFYYIKGTYKSLHDLNHRYEPLPPGKYKQQHCNTPGTVPNVKQCLWTLKIRHRIG